MDSLFTPPKNINERDHCKKSIFLGGTIDMGNSNDWQKELTEALKDTYIIFNPRRENWDSSWEQSIENPYFYQQVMWELNALDKADIILIYFKDNSQSPISLLELGLYANSGKLHVVCEPNFWRKGNVDIVCARYNVPVYKTIEEFIHHIINK
jgi:hypothetical protein